MVVKREKFVNAPARAGEGSRWIYGHHPVAEWLRARPTLLRRVQYDPRQATRYADLLALARTARLPASVATDEILTRCAGTRHHQGIVAETGAFPYADLDQVLQAKARLLVLADQLQDPHNLGALLRTAAAVGAGAVIIPKDGSAMVTPAVEAAAAGAAAIVPVCRVTNAARALEMAKRNSYWSIGLVPSRGIDVYDLEAPERALVVLGGETGMRPLVAKGCDFVVSIPMHGPIESLNASVAAAIVLYELLRKWRQPRGVRARAPEVS